MLCVIFKAEILELDNEYHEMVSRLREKAKSYGCRDFQSLTEGTSEITLSYWDNENQIKRWKNDAEHQQAQQLGKTRWYKSWSVDIVKIERSYEGTHQGGK